MRLEDILEAVSKVASYTSGIDLAAFKVDGVADQVEYMAQQFFVDLDDAACVCPLYSGDLSGADDGARGESRVRVAAF